MAGELMRSAGLGVVLGLIVGILVVTVTGCTPKITRDAYTYEAEIRAAEARQIEAAQRLRTITGVAMQHGATVDDCVWLMEPVVLIEASAAHQAAKALWLARSKSVPEDPGPPPVPADPRAVCAAWAAAAGGVE